MSSRTDWERKTSDAVFGNQDMDKWRRDMPQDVIEEKE